ncbi:SDR family oxidoreductase [Ruegeria sp.]|uniref:SDR family oxidoreductase n=1 Tax=Ruegeria sp. TaxID=1879320 RepID=UPI003B599195
MELKDKIVVVTGAAGGIGRALAQACAQEGAAKVVCTDINLEKTEETAALIGGRAILADVSSEDGIKTLIDTVEAEVGPIDLFCSNAGIAVSGGPEVSDEAWQSSWNINVMSHVWAARHLIPLMTERGGGYLLNTASAAGLLNQIGAATYGVTKHAAVGLAEWLAITYGDQGIRVSVLCPQAVRTDMIKGSEEHVASIDGVMEPEDVAQVCIDAIRDEQFLILPHQQVRGYMQAKAENYEKWIGGMRKLNRSFGML